MCKVRRLLAWVCLCFMNPVLSKLIISGKKKKKNHKSFCESVSGLHLLPSLYAVFVLLSFQIHFGDVFFEIKHLAFILWLFFFFNLLSYVFCHLTVFIHLTSIVRIWSRVSDFRSILFFVHYFLTSVKRYGPELCSTNKPVSKSSKHVCWNLSTAWPLFWSNWRQFIYWIYFKMYMMFNRFYLFIF